jgi:hypothetical protein
MKQTEKTNTKERLLHNIGIIYDAFLEDGRVLWGGKMIENETDFRAQAAKTIEICKETSGYKDITISDWDNVVNKIKKDKGGEINE